MSIQKNVKIAIPSMHPGGLKADRTPYFGRCDCFTIVELTDNQVDTVTIIENDAANATTGAGTAAVMTIASAGVQIVIGGDYGPNAVMALRQAKIEMIGYLKDSSIKVDATIDDFLQGKLPKVI